MSENFDDLEFLEFLSFCHKNYPHFSKKTLEFFKSPPLNIICRKGDLVLFKKFFEDATSNEINFKFENCVPIVEAIKSGCREIILLLISTNKINIKSFNKVVKFFIESDNLNNFDLFVPLITFDRWILEIMLRSRIDIIDIIIENRFNEEKLMQLILEHATRRENIGLVAKLTNKSIYSNKAFRESWKNPNILKHFLIFPEIKTLICECVLYCFLCSHESSFNIIYEYIDYDCKNVIGFPLLFLLFENSEHFRHENSIRMFKKLLNRLDVNIRFGDNCILSSIMMQGISPIFSACEQNIREASLLIYEKYDFEKQKHDHRGNILLLISVEYGIYDFTEKLLSFSDINYKNYEGHGILESYNSLILKNKNSLIFKNKNDRFFIELVKNYISLILSDPKYDFNNVDALGRNLLMICLEHKIGVDKDDEIFNEFYFNFNVNLVDKNGKNLLCYYFSNYEFSHISKTFLVYLLNNTKKNYKYKGRNILDLPIFLNKHSLRNIIPKFIDALSLLPDERLRFLVKNSENINLLLKECSNVKCDGGIKLLSKYL